jgi:hypothetical protein
MSIALVRFGEIDFPQALRRLRNQAALVRALLDELDRVAPAGGAHPAEARLALGAQLTEELRRLAFQMVECFAATTRDPVRDGVENEDAG